VVTPSGARTGMGLAGRFAAPSPCPIVMFARPCG